VPAYNIVCVNCGSVRNGAGEVGRGRFRLICRVKSVRIGFKWGYKEVVKRISCRVVGSVPLSRSFFASEARRGDAGVFRDRDAGAVEVGFDRGNESYGYTFGSNGLREPLVEGGGICLLDCVA